MIIWFMKWFIQKSVHAHIINCHSVQLLIVDPSFPIFKSHWSSKTMSHIFCSKAVWICIIDNVDFVEIFVFLWYQLILYFFSLFYMKSLYVKPLFIIYSCLRYLLKKFVFKFIISIRNNVNRHSADIVSVDINQFIIASVKPY